MRALGRVLALGCIAPLAVSRPASATVSEAHGLSGLAPAPPVTVPAPAYWPTAKWRESLPEEQGLDSGKLAEVLAAIRQKNWSVHNLLVIRNGFVVLDANFFPYDSSLHDLASVTKSVTATLIGEALEQKRVESLSDPVLRYFPDRVAANPDPRKNRLTIADLLSMRSGLGCEYDGGEPTLKQMMSSPDWVQFVLDRPIKEEPGQEFVYCSPALHLLSALISRATGQPTLEFAKEQLFGPLGITETIWPSDPSGIARGWGDLHLRPRDLAKIGFLYLHDGMWDGKQILSRDFVRSATTPLVKTPTGDDYGLGWWISPTEHQNEFSAIGRGGQALTVFRRLNAIVVVTGGGNFDPGEIDAMLAHTVTSSSALPPNPRAVAELKRELRTIASAPRAHPSPQEPAVAHQISGRVYAFCTNPLGWLQLSMDFDAPEPLISLSVSDTTAASGSRTERHPMGLGFPLVSTGGQFGLPVAIEAQWVSDREVSVDYDSIANINAYRFLISPSATEVKVRVQQRGSDKKLQLEGRVGQRCP